MSAYFACFWSGNVLHTLKDVLFMFFSLYSLYSGVSLCSQREVWYAIFTEYSWWTLLCVLCEVFSVKCKVPSVKCAVCGVCSVKCAVYNVQC